MGRILIVDDVSMIQGNIRLFLQESGHEIVAEASDGLTVVSLCARHRPDVVIMDISMPNLDGIEASKTILEKFPNTKILVMSIYGDSHHVKKVGRLGIGAFLVKPFSRTRLLDEIDKIFHNMDNTTLY